MLLSPGCDVRRRIAAEKRAGQGRRSGLAGAAYATSSDKTKPLQVRTRMASVAAGNARIRPPSSRRRIVPVANDQMTAPITNSHMRLMAISAAPRTSGTMATDCCSCFSLRRHALIAAEETSRLDAARARCGPG